MFSNIRVMYMENNKPTKYKKEIYTGMTKLKARPVRHLAGIVKKMSAAMIKYHYECSKSPGSLNIV